MRLQKYMAHCDVSSRRKCELIILEGRVKINGKIVTEIGVQIDPNIDIVEVDGKRISLNENKIYIVLNKPCGYITSVKDQFGRPTVLQLIEQQPNRIYPVGRLDFNTEGLIILTNDGELAYNLTHPKYEISKEYYVIVKGQPSYEEINKLSMGVDLGEYRTHNAYIKKIGIKKDNSIYKVIIHEGKNRQVRKMFEHINHPVIFLRRERIGNIVLGSLKPGQWRYLTKDEVEQLKKYEKGDK